MGQRSRDNQNFSDRSGAYAPGSVVLLGMGVRSRARSSANTPYVRHHKVSPSPNPHLKASNSIYIERLPFVWKTRKFGGEFK